MLAALICLTVFAAQARADVVADRAALNTAYQARLEELARELPEGKVVVLDGDLADPAFRARLWQRAEEFPGGLDVLVNNAGLGHYDDLECQDEATIRQIVEVNIMALIDLTRRAIRHMKARGGGQIVEVSSVLGFIGLPYSAVYVASKHAVNGLVKSLRYELRGSGVRVWAACPGQTESEFFTSALGEGRGEGPKPKGASTVAVVRAIVRGIDGKRGFLLPGFIPWATVSLAHWLPGPFDWAMGRWSARLFGRQIERARGGGSADRPREEAAS